MFGVDFHIISSGKIAVRFREALTSLECFSPTKILLRFAVRLIWIIIFLPRKFQEDESCKGNSLD